MKTRKIILSSLSAILLFMACDHRPEKVTETISNNDTSVIAIIIPELWDTLIKSDCPNPVGESIRIAIGSIGKVFYFNGNKSYCKQSGDTIIVGLHSTRKSPTDYLILKMIGNRYQFSYEEQYEHNTIYPMYLDKQASVCPMNPKVGDSISVFIYYRGLFRYRNPIVNDTFMIYGSIKTRIREQTYNYGRYIFEMDSLNMVNALTTKLPDTVRTVNFSNCLLKKIPLNLERFKNLESLTLDFNGFKNEDFSILDKFKKLKFLSLYGCNLNQFPISLLNLSKLEILDLADNKLKSLPKEIYHMKKLKSLNLLYNRNIDSVTINRENKNRISEIIF